jgi:FKBP-type peptidyl-prolyl cis-trans isomerase
MQSHALASGRRAGMRPPSLASSPAGRVVTVVARTAASAPQHHRRRAPLARSSDGDADADGASSSSTSPTTATTMKKKKRQADSTDAVASFLTRRFGIAGGLAWLGVLTFGVVSEQLKTRQELREESEGTRDATASVERPLAGLGASYRELRVGGGARPQRGDLVVLEFSARFSADGGQTYAEPPFADTARTKKPVVLVWGARPLAAVICPAVEAAIADGMRAGGRRVVTVEQGGAGGFGATGGPPGVPQGGAALKFDVTLSRVSVAPS